MAVSRSPALVGRKPANTNALPPENATGNFTKVVQRVPVKIVIDPAEASRAGWLRAGLSVTAEADMRGPDAQRLGFFAAAAATLRHVIP